MVEESAFIYPAEVSRKKKKSSISAAVKRPSIQKRKRETSYNEWGTSYNKRGTSYNKQGW